VESAVAVVTVLLDGLVERALLGDVSLFVASIAEAVTASASKKGVLNRTSTVWGQGHPIFGCGA